MSPLRLQVMPITNNAILVGAYAILVGAYAILVGAYGIAVGTSQVAACKGRRSRRVG